MKFGTKAIHLGIDPDPVTGAIMTPIYQTSTFVQDAPGVPKTDKYGQIYEYARTHNPTRIILERNLAGLENAKHALCFASGLAATDALMKLLKPGDEVIAGDDLYGGSRRMFSSVFAQTGIKFHFVDLRNADAILSFLNEKTKMVWLETPTNPMLSILDIKAIGKHVSAYNKDIIFAVDNTFSSPYLQNPLDLGADVVLHSVTKYLGGHSDVVMGCIMCNDVKANSTIYDTSNPTVFRQLQWVQNAVGAVPGPFDCFLTLRGVKTLHLRMKQHCENAAAVAKALKASDLIDEVYWPGFDYHTNHQVAKEQMKGFGGMVSFRLKEDTYEAATRIMKAFKVFSIAESLGGVESIANYPVKMTHGSVPYEVRQELGITAGFIRLSVGIEDTEDLVEDIKQALNTIALVSA